MADNFDVVNGQFTGTVAADSLGGSPEVKVQRLKQVWGVDGTAVDTSASNPLPVTVISSSVGSTVITESGTTPVGQTNVTAVVSLPYTLDVATGLWGRAGASTFFSLDLDETEEDVKTTAGILYGFAFSNLHATLERFLWFWNGTAATVTPGTTPAFFGWMLPFKSTGFHWFGPQGPAFSTALSAGATTGVTGAGPPGTNEVLLTVWFK